MFNRISLLLLHLQNQFAYARLQYQFAYVLFAISMCLCSFCNISRLSRFEILVGYFFLCNTNFLSLI